MYKQQNKYRNTKLKTSEGVFDSKKEYMRWRQLKELEAMGKIKDLQRQTKYELIPSQRRDGKVIERAVCYYADFDYVTADGLKVVEDVKSNITRKKPEYVIKRKLMLDRHGIRVREV